MKHCIIAMGGAGLQSARAFGYCALAGLVELNAADILLVDTDKPVHPMDDWCRDYMLLRALWPEGRAINAFRTALTVRTWPGPLPAEAATLRSLAQDEEDHLLLDALWDEKVAGADLRGGFHGLTDAAAMMLTGLLGSGSGNPGDALEDMLREIEDDGGEARIVLLGSAMGGMGAAGLTTLSRYTASRLPQAELAAVVMLPYFRAEEEQPSVTRATLRQWGMDGLCDTVFLLGLPQSAYLAAAEGHQQARMPEWLAALCAARFLVTGCKGMYGWRAPFDHFGWDAFGDQARAVRQGFGMLMRAAMALKMELGEVIRRGVLSPNWLRDKMIPWYARHFMAARRMTQAEREDMVRQLEALMRLTEEIRSWMAEMIITLPPQLRTGSEMDEALREAEENYILLVRQDAQLAMLKQSAERSGLTEGMIYRSGRVDAEGEELRRNIDAAEKTVANLEEKRKACLRRTGGQAYMAMLRDVSARCRQETEQFRAQTAEAAEIIRKAEEKTDAAGMSRIATARTKLMRMEQSLALLEARVARTQADILRAREEGLRSLPPELKESGLQAESQLYSARAMAAADRRQLEQLWPEMVRGMDGQYAQYKECIAQAESTDKPMAGFLAALMYGREGE